MNVRFFTGAEERERKSERERERKRERERERDRETETETERQRERETETETETDRQTDRQTDRERERGTNIANFHHAHTGGRNSCILGGLGLHAANHCVLIFMSFVFTPFASCGCVIM